MRQQTDEGERCALWTLLSGRSKQGTGVRSPVVRSFLRPTRPPSSRRPEVPGPHRCRLGSTITTQSGTEDLGQRPQPDIGIVPAWGQQAAIRRERYAGEPIVGATDLVQLRAGNDVP